MFWGECEMKAEQANFFYNGATQNLAVLGWPISHSLSPAIQNAALRQAGLNFVYISLPVAAENLSAAVSGLRAMNFRGFNVTIPHKTAIMQYLDEIDPAAQIIGAVNTVVNDDGKLIGYNTDAYGFMNSLLKENFVLDGSEAVVMGAGGAAQAVVQSLSAAGANITVGARNGTKAATLADKFAPHYDIHSCAWQTEEFVSALSKADLLVNTTPLGMKPHLDEMPPVDWAKLKATALVYDVIYTPSQTILLKEAKAHGFGTLNGEGMLVGQGAKAFQLWTGVQPDTELMTAVLRAELAKK